MDNSTLNKAADSINKGYNLYLDMIDKILDIAADISKDSETAVRILNSEAVRKSAPHVVLISACVDFNLITLAIVKKRRKAKSNKSFEE